jgi:LacI family transcriptional regulator
MNVSRGPVSDAFAVGLASRRSRLLGLVIPTITNSIYASSTQAIQRVAQTAGYTVLLGISDFGPEQEERLIDKLIGRRIEGLILTGEIRARGIFERLERRGIPYVVTWKLTENRHLPCVSFDNQAAARAAVEHLIGLGHRRIGLICGRTDVNDRAAARRRGFEATLARHRIAVDPALVSERDFEFVEGRSAMHQMLQQRDRPTAVFCANDIQAIGAMYECQRGGLKVPQHISVVGFDDLPISRYTTPQLTTIRVPADEMGRRAAELLVRAIEGERGATRVELPTDLVVRHSTAPPPR